MKGTKYHIHGKMQLLLLLLLLLSFWSSFLLSWLCSCCRYRCPCCFCCHFSCSYSIVLSLWLLRLYTLLFLGVPRPAFELEHALFDMECKKVLSLKNQPSSDSVNLVLRFQITRTLLWAGSSGRSWQAIFVSPCHHRKDASESSRNIW